MTCRADSLWLSGRRRRREFAFSLRNIVSHASVTCLMILWSVAATEPYDPTLHHFSLPWSLSYRQLALCSRACCLETSYEPLASKHYPHPFTSIGGKLRALGAQAASFWPEGDWSLTIAKFAHPVGTWLCQGVGRLSDAWIVWQLRPLSQISPSSPPCPEACSTCPYTRHETLRRAIWWISTTF